MVFSIRFSIYRQQIISYYHIFMGLTSYWYCKEQDKYERNMGSRLFHIMLNVVSLLVMCFKLQNFIEEFRKAQALHPLITLLFEMNNRLRSLLVAHTVLHVIRYDRLITCMRMELQELKSHCLREITLRPDIEARFKYLFWAKLLFLYYIYIISLVMTLTTANNVSSIWQIMMNIAFVNINGLWYFVLFQYFEIIWKICCLFYYIEQHVCHIAQEAVATAVPLEGLARKLYWSLRMHSKLCVCWLQLQNGFKWQIFLSRLVNVTSNSTNIFYAFVSSASIYQSLLMLTMGSLSYLVITLDLYINDYMCDMTVNSFEGLHLALKEFNGVQHTWTALHLQCEEFSLYLCNRKVNLKLAGALNMDRKAWLSLISTLATYSIVLIQVHLANL
ncbi:putative gustatory receptor 59b [Stomoxys calcitrans]|uniref:putative gustatory receptor 59b n=1 Tax=Stomoxys calcitrans TaxID=35570 RepID=UPI0027E3AAB0|nr:putative gustatory receptor 59b [Stomoxys calcitrans]